MSRTTIALALAAGLAAAAHAQPARVNPRGPSPLRPWPVADIHYNLRTGERVVHPVVAAPRPRGVGVWLNNNTDQCGTGMIMGNIDIPDIDGDGGPDPPNGCWVPCTLCDAGPTIPCEGSWNNWWGDIPADTVVDCVRIAFGILAPDTDADGDGVGDGIVGYDLILTFSDNDNGFGYDGAGASGRSCIIELTVPTLPGAPPGTPAGYIPVYYLTLDLADTAPSLVFELGDSDGIDDAGTGHSGAAVYGHPTFADRDGDTLHDFSYALRFDQSEVPVPAQGPGLSKGPNYYVAVAPRGCTSNWPDTCPTPTDPPGLADAKDIYSSGPSCPPSITTFIGTFYFGGFDCDSGIPYDSCFLELYGTPALACSPADNAPPFGILDFSDVLGFLSSTIPPGSQYAAGFAPPSDVFDFSDVLAFLTLFAQGCP